MPLGREYRQIKCTHVRTYTILHAPISPWGCHMAINPEKLQHQLCAITINTPGVVGSCQPGVNRHNYEVSAYSLLKLTLLKSYRHFHHHKPPLFIPSTLWKQTPTHSLTSLLRGRWYFTPHRGVPFSTKPCSIVGCPFWSHETTPGSTETSKFHRCCPASCISWCTSLKLKSSNTPDVLNLISEFKMFPWRSITYRFFPYMKIKLYPFFLFSVIVAQCIFCKRLACQSLG